MPDFSDTKKVDKLDKELIAMKASRKAKSDERKAAVEEMHVGEARKQMQKWADENGMSLEDACEYWQGRLTENGDPGRWIQANLAMGAPGKAI